MILKSITMHGFKSFADKTTIELDGNVCAVVGPNGSGKSNISDAILWVLGEQSAKTLRGNKMEDVIFTGTPKRKPSGFAEVTLTLDNTGRTLPVEYDEVAFTRRVYRSGEGEYFINKTPCRLKDIHEMLMDTGMGRDGYSIIGQGKIDRILYANPDDRRAMFEEASGISKYKYRKAEASRKLDKTNDNLVRIQDIVSELETQVGPLKEQSEKAKKFLALSEELKGLEVTALVNSIEKNRASLEKAKKNYEDIELQFNEKKAVSEENDKIISAYYEEKKNLDDALEEIKNQAAEIKMNIARHESEIIVKEGTISNIAQNIGRLESEIKELLIQSESSSPIEAEKLVFKAKERKEQLMREYNELDIVSQREKVDILVKEAGAKSSSIDLLSVKKEGKTGRLESFDVIAAEQGKRIDTLKDEIKSIEKEIDSIKEDLSELNMEKIKAEEEREKFGEEKKALQESFDELNSQDEKLKAEYNKEYSALQESLSRLKFLNELEKDMDGYSGAVKSIVENKNLKGIRGVLSELIHVDSKYVQAIEAALGGSMQNIVTETDRASREAIDYLKSKGKGRATFLPLNIIKPRGLDKMSHEGYLGPASDFVNCDEDIVPAVLNLLGNVALCDTFDNAIGLYKSQNGKVKIVTLSGEYINSGGAVTGGSMSKVRGLLSRKQEIESLSVTCEKQREAVKLSEQNIEKNEKQIELVRKNANALKEKIEESSTKYAELLSSVEIKKGALLSKEERFFEMKTEFDELKSGFENRDKAKEELRLSILEAEEELIRERENLKELTLKLEEERETLEKINQARIDKTIEINSASKDIEMYFNALENARRGEESRKQLAEIKREEINKNNLETESVKNEIAQIKIRISELEVLHGEKIKELDLRKDEFAKRDDTTSKLLSSNKTLQEEMIALAQEMTKLSGKTEFISEAVETDIGRLWEDYELTYSEAVKERDEKGSKTSSSSLINKLKREIKELGTVNVAAIEDYKQVSERYEFLSGQKADMLETKENLEKIIAEMQKIMSELFTIQFENINQSFKKTYVELTGGGNANISLEDSDDVLGSGIEIEIQPPGKKLQNIMLLSGGEKAIAGIALFFAMLSVRPTPFCVLDEIEAALDEGNVLRFASFLHNYKDTQFLVITHRRGTMESADMLYGVTMQEKGVTKLLSLKLSEVDKQ